MREKKGAAGKGREPMKITVIEYVHVGDRLVRYDELSEQQKRKADALIVQEWLNGLFLGKARFYAPEELTGVPVPKDAERI